jgi:hypothetical protein
MRGACRRRKTNDRSPGKLSLSENANIMERFNGPAVASSSDMKSKSNTHNSSTNCLTKSEMEDDFMTAHTVGSSAVTRVVNSDLHLDSYDVLADLPEGEEAELPFRDHPYCMQQLHRTVRMHTATEAGNGPMPDTRTKGRKYAAADTDYGGIVDEVNDDQLMNLVVQMSVPRCAIPSRLIIPMIRVPRSIALLDGATPMDMTMEMTAAACAEGM